MNLFVELRRRNVLRAAVLYASAVWALAQGIAQLGPFFGAPDWTVRWFVLACVVGFPFWIAFAWFYEFTPHGIKRDSEVTDDAPIRHSTARKLDVAIIGILIVAVVLLASGYFIRRNAPAGAATQSAPAKSIAVLPFVNMSGDAKNEYFSDGITVEILNALAQIPTLKVAGRTSAFAFKGKEADTRKIGETLGVATVLEGSVQESGDEVRITVQLVDARSGYQMWSENYDRRLTNIFAIEDEISNAVASKLRLQVVGRGGQELVRRATVDPETHALYLHAIADIARRGPALKDAALLLQQAIARDPGYVDALAALSQVQELLPWYQLADWPGSLVSAEQSATRALALDPRSGEAHAALANVLRDRLDYAAADREYRKALALSPGSSEIHNQFAQFLMMVAAAHGALEQERIAVSLDPLAPNPRYNLGWELLAERRVPEAVAEFKTVLEHSPDYTYARFQIAFAKLYAGRYDEARKLMHAAEVQAGLDPAKADTLIKACADPALRRQALQLVERVDHVGRVQLDVLAQAFWYGLLGAREPAIASLQRWVAGVPPGKSNEGMRYLRLPAFDSIRNDPRFKAALAKLGLPYRPEEVAPDSARTASVP